MNICGPGIKRVREEKGMKRKDLAFLASDEGFTYAEEDIRMMEEGEEMITDLDLVAFSEAMEVSMRVFYKTTS